MAMENGRCRIHGGKTPGGISRSKHGLYRKRFTGEEQEMYDALMKDNNFEDLRGEIALIRIIIDRCAKAIAEGDEWRVPMQSIPMYIEKLLKSIERMRPQATKLVSEDELDRELKDMLREEAQLREAARGADDPEDGE